MIDLYGPAVRLDPSGWEALVAGAAQPDVAAALADDRLTGVMKIVQEPAAMLRVVVAGAADRLQHMAWIDNGVVVLLLGVQPGLLQLMTTPVEFLTVSLVRLIHLRPRHVSPREPVPFPAAELDELVCDDPSRRAPALVRAGADFAWRVELAWGDGNQVIVGVDGERGLHLATPAADVLTPVTNTAGYRVLSTVLDV